MLRRLLNNIFATSYQGEVEADKFNHCSTVCPQNNGVVLAWYSGSGECRDDQSVYVTFYKDGTYFEPLRIGDKTGNPVIWSSYNHTFLIWSKFEDTGKLRSVVDRWKHCSLWIQELKISDRISLVGEPRLFAPSDYHLLGRCNPICYGKVGYRSDYLLPLYDEMGRQGVIYRIRISDKTSKKRGINYSMSTAKCSVIGQNMIQPTLWQSGNIIHSLSRNFGTRDAACRYSFSYDRGDTWSDPVKTSILNRNSSLHAIEWNNMHLLLWNDTDTLSRINLRLGFIKFESNIPSVTKICTISEMGHYPSMCVDHLNNLHMTFSNSQKKIEHHVWNKKQLEREAYRRGDSSG